MHVITTAKELYQVSLEETEAMRGGPDEETEQARRKVGLEEKESHATAK